VCVDEFQDFSQLFMQLILGLRHRNSQIRLFCVGDDWQAINGFTGAKLHFFHRAHEFFPGMRRIELLTNFRSASSIVEFGNDVMAGFGSPARAREASGVGSVRIYCLDAFVPQHIEHVRHRADPQVPMLLRLIQAALSKTRQKITVLCRTNTLADPINAGIDSKHTYTLLDLQDELHRYLPKWAHPYVQVSTVHTYKGMESDCVIVIDALEQRYPHIHPDWVLTRIFGNSIEEVIEEERRLFYVAVTRAKVHLVVLTQTGAVTPFLSDNQIQGVPTYIRSAKDLDLLQPLKRQSEKMTVHVGTKPTQFGAIAAIKDALLKAGYFYSNPAQAWCKTFLPQDLNNIITEDWISLASDIYIEICDEHNQLYALVHVEDGNWITLHKNEESLKPLLSENDYESAP
jgi:DNA helicase-4